MKQLLDMQNQAEEAVEMEFSISDTNNNNSHRKYSDISRQIKISPRPQDKMDVEESKETNQKGGVFPLPSHHEMLKRSRAAKGSHRRQNTLQMMDHIIATEEAKEVGNESPDEGFDFDNALRNDPSPERQGGLKISLGTSVGYQPVIKQGMTSSRNLKTINQALENANNSFSLRSGSIDLGNGFEKLIAQTSTKNANNEGIDRRETLSKAFEAISRQQNVEGWGTLVEKSHLAA